MAQVEKDEAYIKAIVGLAAIAEQAVKENNALDIYEEYWEGADAGRKIVCCSISAGTAGYGDKDYICSSRQGLIR